VTQNWLCFWPPPTTIPKKWSPPLTTTTKFLVPDLHISTTSRREIWPTNLKMMEQLKLILLKTKVTTGPSIGKGRTTRKRVKWKLRKLAF